MKFERHPHPFLHFLALSIALVTGLLSLGFVSPAIADESEWKNGQIVLRITQPNEDLWVDAYLHRVISGPEGERIAEPFNAHYSSSGDLTALTLDFYNLPAGQYAIALRAGFYTPTWVGGANLEEATLFDVSAQEPRHEVDLAYQEPPRGTITVPIVLPEGYEETLQELNVTVLHRDEYGYGDFTHYGLQDMTGYTVTVDSAQSAIVISEVPASPNAVVRITGPGIAMQFVGATVQPDSEHQTQEELVGSAVSANLADSREVTLPETALVTVPSGTLTALLDLPEGIAASDVAVKVISRVRPSGGWWSYSSPEAYPFTLVGNVLTVRGVPKGMEVTIEISGPRLTTVYAGGTTWSSSDETEFLVIPQGEDNVSFGTIAVRRQTGNVSVFVGNYYSLPAEVRAGLDITVGSVSPEGIFTARHAASSVDFHTRVSNVLTGEAYTIRFSGPGINTSYLGGVTEPLSAQTFRIDRHNQVVNLTEQAVMLEGTENLTVNVSLPADSSGPDNTAVQLVDAEGDTINANYYWGERVGNTQTVRIINAPGDSTYTVKVYHERAGAVYPKNGQRFVRDIAEAQFIDPVVDDAREFAPITIQMPEDESSEIIAITGPLTRGSFAKLSLVDQMHRLLENGSAWDLEQNARWYTSTAAEGEEWKEAPYDSWSGAYLDPNRPESFIKVVTSSNGVEYSAIAQYASTPALNSLYAVYDRVPELGVIFGSNGNGSIPNGVTLSYQWFLDGEAIDGATESSVLVPDEAYGKPLVLKITASRAYHEDVVFERVTKPVEQGRLRISGDLTVEGDPAVGSVLTAASPNWKAGSRYNWQPLDVTGVTESFQWYLDGTAIEGATERTFTPTPEMLGRSIHVVVTGSKENYTSSSVTSTSVTVGEGMLEAISGPELKGNFEILSAPWGTTLRVDPGTWNGTNPDFTYQWKVGDGDWTPGTDAFVTNESHFDKRISVRVSVAADGYKTEHVEVHSAKIGAKDRDNLQIPRITGEETVGSTLSAVSGDWQGEPAEETYQWLIDGSEVPGATEGTFEIPVEALGKTIAVRQTVTGYGYLATSATSESTGPVRAGTLEATKAPSVAGRAVVNQSVTANGGQWSVEPAEVSFQWLVGGQVVPGATGTSFKIPASALGKSLAVRVTVVAQGYETFEYIVEVTSKVGAGAMSVTAAPKLSGTSRVGAVLSVSTGSWSQSGVALKYQWYAGGKAISGATKNKITIPRSAVGKRMSVKVTASKAGYSSVSRTVTGTKNVAKTTATASGTLSKTTVKRSSSVTVRVRVKAFDVAAPTGTVYVKVGSKTVKAAVKSSHKGTVRVVVPGSKLVVKSKQQVSVRFVPSGTTAKSTSPSVWVKAGKLTVKR